MRSRATDLLRAALVLAAIAAATACVIGPKQDDPASLGPTDDASVADTTPPENLGDTASGAADGTMDNTDSALDAIAPSADTGCMTDGDAGCGDAATDATDAMDAMDAMDATEGG